jgi:hypothetical protein
VVVQLLKSLSEQGSIRRQPENRGPVLPVQVGGLTTQAVDLNPEAGVGASVRREIDQ